MRDLDPDDGLRVSLWLRQHRIVRNPLRERRFGHPFLEKESGLVSACTYTFGGATGFGAVAAARTITLGGANTFGVEAARLVCGLTAASLRNGELGASSDRGQSTKPRLTATASATEARPALRIGGRAGNRGSSPIPRLFTQSSKCIVVGALLRISEHRESRCDLSHSRLQRRIGVLVGMVKTHESHVRGADYGIFRPRHYAEALVMVSGHAAILLTSDEILFRTLRRNTIVSAPHLE